MNLCKELKGGFYTCSKMKPMDPYKEREGEFQTLIYSGAKLSLAVFISVANVSVYSLVFRFFQAFHVVIFLSFSKSFSSKFMLVDIFQYF
jgi:hypothetical protein